VIAIFTDFGVVGPYTGQVKAVLQRDAPGVPVIDLMSDAPSFAPRAAAYLLAALVAPFPEETVFLAVVDPGVGNPNREPLLVRALDRWFVGPGNGLFEIVCRRGPCACWRIDWRPPQLSETFHGRDLFAPVAARVARGDEIQKTEVDFTPDPNFPDDLTEVIYIDAFGNAMLGVRGQTVDRGMRIDVSEHRGVNWARTFSEVSVGQAFWHVNAHGLVEISVNQGDASARLGLTVGSGVKILAGS